MLGKADLTMQLKKNLFLAVVRVDTVERGMEIADGCYRGGVKSMEISFTTNVAPDVIREINKKYGDKMMVGAGTVLNEAAAENAYRAGAKFLYSPIFDEGVNSVANTYQIPYAAGCTTYTEAIKAMRAGVAFIKAFPISNYYGPNLAKVFKTPVPQMPILASGGINLKNIAEWYQDGAEVLACGGLFTKGSADDIAENGKKANAIIDKIGRRY